MKDGRKGELAFLNQYKELSPLEVLLMVIKKIDPDKVITYQEFLTDLINEVYDTFLGNDTICTTKHMEEHYTYCFNKVSEKYVYRTFRFVENDQLFDYILEYFKENLYLHEESREVDFRYFEFFLHYQKCRKKFEVVGFLDLYQIFDLTPRKGRFLKK